MTRSEVVARLRAYQPKSIQPGRSRESAVMVLLRQTLHNPEGLEVVLTRRSDKLAAHPGQVSFPGGRLDAADASPVEAALRETREELGVEPSSIEVIGGLDEILTFTGFHVRAVTGLLTPQAVLIPNPAEVARVFCVPLNELLLVQRWQSRPHPWRGGVVDVWHFEHDDEDIWGITGMIILQMLDVLGWKGKLPVNTDVRPIDGQK